MRNHPSGKRGLGPITGKVLDEAYAHSFGHGAYALRLCWPPHPNAEVFYRSFDSTSIMDLDAAALSRASDRHLFLSKPGQLQALNKVCLPAPPESVRDLRLVIRWTGSAAWSWEASQFAYRDSRTGKTCQFSPAQQDALLAALGLER
ncbi:hypothetical protein M0D45_11620 [Xanthomonas prunicola]|uniref:hypothetical protein n=1 Tax=Xanthomonas prunicola TaxID=2053930 RepID=UPI0021B3FDF8|nr:hypothetical protein [Xanthomonas prunicola]UXA51405.1 hypothetical protein M0D45_11620 [Xanthomonas prunicola]